MQALNRMQVHLHTCSLGFTGKIMVWWRLAPVATCFVADCTVYKTRSD